jgi:hypothetical protein
MVKKAARVDESNERLSKLVKGAEHLDIPVTKAQIWKMINEVMRSHPECVKVNSTGRWDVVDAPFDRDRMCHHFETIFSTLRAELGSIIFRAIPREKSRYCHPGWLVNTPIFAKFPATVDELQRAGRCFAYGENTAFVFHLMRVADFYLRKVAESLAISYDARNWHGIAERITQKMEQKYQTKTDDWKHKEPFYAEMLTDIQAISRGHRNPVLHELEKKYDEREGEYMLTVIERFAAHVAENV